MESFRFASPLLPRPLSIDQRSAGVIGFKVYPGALLLARELERAASGAALPPAARAALQAAVAPGALVLELGAGVCGLPSLLLAAGGGGARHVVATDMPAVLPLLSRNAQAAAEAAAGPGGERDGGGSCVRVAPLAWGEAGGVSALRAGALGGRAPDVILGADVVYHEPLIAPLLAALVALTEAEAGAGVGAGAGASAPPPPPPPPVLLAYVQRFKRARAFFRLARRWFDVVAVPLGRVVDYDALTWQHAGALRRGGRTAGEGEGGGGDGGGDGSGGDGGSSAPTPVLHSGSADYATYLEAVCTAAEEARAAGGEAGSAACPAAPASAPAPAPAPAPVYRGVDSDSEADAGKEPGMALFAGVEVEEQGSGGSDGEGEACDAADAHVPLRRRAQAAAAELGLPRLAEPLHAYLYVLTRRPAGGLGGSAREKDRRQRE